MPRNTKNKTDRADYVLANGRMSSNQSGDCNARSAMKSPKVKPQSLPRQRDIRRDLIDARKLGTLIDCVHRELTDADLEKITSTYHAWRGETGLTRRRGERGEKKSKKSSLPLRVSASPREYSDRPGFCKSAATAIYVHAYRDMWDNEAHEETEEDREAIQQRTPAIPEDARAVIKRYLKARFKRRLNP